ncbi:hypothetical protein KKA39_03250 [Patescibacteria group bacterium]|nr:hypothetical protein [Pseudomonadota bacterium]MBU1728292.1 hypothetical protein [Patescibacteria group bacterium]
MTKFSIIDDFVGQCGRCVRKNGDSRTCGAFPKGIPDEILMGDFIHKEKHPDQENNILFELKDQKKDMNIDALPHNQDWIKTLSWNLPAYKSTEFLATITDLNKFKHLPLYKSAVQKGLIQNDVWAGPKEGYCKIKRY